MTERWRRYGVALLMLVSGCARDCAGPYASATAARAEGQAWRATLQCVPRTKIGAGRGDLFERQGCTARATLTVDGRARSATQEFFNLLHDRDCGRVRAYCRGMRGRVLARTTPEGTVVGAQVEGGASTLLVHVTGEGFAFRRDPLPAHGAIEAAIGAAPTPDALLAAMLRDGVFARDGRVDLGDAFQGATLRRLRGAVLEAAARCAAPTEALANLIREDPSQFDVLYASGWSGPRCEGSRAALEWAARATVAARVRADLAASRGTAPPEVLDPLVVTVGRLEVRDALLDVGMIARAAPAPRGTNEALWLHALWAWSRIDREGAARAAVAMLLAAPDAPVTTRSVRPFDGAVPRWDPYGLVLARCAASGGAALHGELVALARDASAARGPRRYAVLALAAHDGARARALDGETGLGALAGR